MAIYEITKTPDGRLKCSHGFEAKSLTTRSMREHLIQKHGIPNWAQRDLLLKFFLDKHQTSLRWKPWC